MKSIKRMYRLVACCLTVLLVTTNAPIAQAQDDGVAFINLRLIEVHADKVSEFEDLMKQRSAAEAKAGERFNHVFQRLRGVLNGYLIISPVGPISSRFFAIAFAPSSTLTTIGPSVMNFTRSLKKGRSLWTA